MTLQDYIKRAEDAVSEGSIAKESAWLLIGAIPAMAQALIEAEEALKNDRDCMNAGVWTDDDRTRNGQALSKIQKLKEMK